MIHFGSLPLTAADEARFWALVDIRDANSCWPWLGSTRGGYGLFSLGGRKGKIIPAHCVALAMALDHAPENHGLHDCDNPPCCNPAHLLDGTHAQNMAQCAARGRQKVPRPGNGYRKIDDAASVAIFELRRDGQNFCEIGRAFNVSAWTARHHYQKHASE